MRYPQEITLEVRNEEPDKKRRFTPRSLFKHPLRNCFKTSRIVAVLPSPLGGEGPGVRGAAFATRLLKPLLNSPLTSDP